MPLCNEKVKKTVPPCLPQDVAEGTLGGVEEIDEGARDRPLKCSVNLDGKEAHGFAEPVEQRELAVSRTHENTSESQKLRRQEPICMRLPTG
jgi:hypothetical protein